MAKKSLPKSYPRIDCTVTQADLETAIRADSTHCVVADAIRRELGAQRVEVDLQAITFTDPKRGLRLTYLTPEVCQEHLIAFDQGWPVAPFAFYLRAPIRIRRGGGGAGKAHKAAPVVKKERSERVAELIGQRNGGHNLAPGAGRVDEDAGDRCRGRAEQKPTRQRSQGNSLALEQCETGDCRWRQASGAAHGVVDAKGRRRTYGLRLAKPGVMAD